VIAVPRSPAELSITEWDLEGIKRSYLRRAVAGQSFEALAPEDVEFLAAEVGSSPEEVSDLLAAGEPGIVDRVGA
jgi:hypothetical protein